MDPPRDSRGFEVLQDDLSGSVQAGEGAEGAAKSAGARGPASPRAVMLAHLTADMGAALAAGDLSAARVAHEGIRSASPVWPCAP